MDAMTLKSLGKAYKGSLPIVIRRDTVAHLLDNNDQHPPQVLQAADEIVASLQSLHDHQWPEDRFVTEMAGHYLLDPDDDAGPFFWLPNYALACLPLWAILTIFAARYFIRRYRAAMLTYDQQRGEAIKSLRAAR
jgi:hypothetical protein